LHGVNRGAVTADDQVVLFGAEHDLPAERAQPTR
jgi:hypothetical protein